MSGGKRGGAVQLRPRDRVCFIAAPEQARCPLTQTVRQTAQGGAGLIQLRDKMSPADALKLLAENLRAALRPTGARLIVNGNIEVAEAVEADGAHLPERASIEQARARLGKTALIGYSAHSVDGLRRAEDAGADYAFLSPVFPTRSKPGAAPLGLKRFERAASQTALPVYALGGIQPDNARMCLEAGAFGVAALSAFSDSNNAADAARRFLNVLEAYDQSASTKEG